MHSKIFQISNKPISKEDYADPETYYENSDDFADYIGDEVDEEDREDYYDYMAKNLAGVFTHEGNGVYVYQGAEALQVFKQEWADYIKEFANDLTADNLFKNQRLYMIRKITEETHIGTSYRVDIAHWAEGVAYPFGELFEYAGRCLKKGDRIYVGAIIDYHY